MQKNKIEVLEVLNMHYNLDKKVFTSPVENESIVQQITSTMFHCDSVVKHNSKNIAIEDIAQFITKCNESDIQVILHRNVK